MAARWAAAAISGRFGKNAFTDGLDKSPDSPKLLPEKSALKGQSGMAADIPCATCDLYLSMKRDGRWLSDAEIEGARGRAGVLVSIVVEAGESAATHVDLCAVPGHAAGPPARPPEARRIALEGGAGISLFVPAGQYTIYALPKRLDPAFRKYYPDMALVTTTITVAARPVAQEFHVRLAD